MSIESRGNDPLMNAIARLGAHEPDSRRVKRTRARCHRAIARNGRVKQGAGFAGQPLSARALEPALIGVVSAAFLFDVVRRALQLWGF
jgi:hypothetical protein